MLIRCVIKGMDKKVSDYFPFPTKSNTFATPNLLITNNL